MGLFDYNPDSLKQAAKVKAGTASPGLTKSDWGGIGLQLLGGYLQDAQQQKQLEEQRKLDENLRDQQNRQSAIQRMIDAQQWQDAQVQQNRKSNLEGLNFLSNMRDQARQDARQRSYRDAILKAGA